MLRRVAIALLVLTAACERDAATSDAAPALAETLDLSARPEPPVVDTNPRTGPPDPPPSLALGHVAPLSPEARAVFEASPDDPEPAFLDAVNVDNYGTHFFASDEWNHQVYIPHIADIGGGYVGVGADQGFLLIGWARPELAWFIDYDAVIIELHDIWAEFFDAAQDPAQLRRLWSEAGRDEAIALLEARADDPDRARARVRAFRRARHRVDNRLELLLTKHHREGISSYLTDAEDFAYVQAMIRAGRVRAMRVDLTAREGLQGIAAAARELGVPIRLLYTSNAQTYWRYDEGQFPANVAALPFDADALVLHTIATPRAKVDYRYCIHDARDFVRALDEGARDIFSLTPWPGPQGTDPHVELNGRRFADAPL